LAIGRLSKVVCCYIKLNKTIFCIQEDTYFAVKTNYWFSLLSGSHNFWILPKTAYDSKIFLILFCKVLWHLQQNIKHRFHCNWNFIHKYYWGIKFVLKGVLDFISYLLILILLQKIHSLFYLLMDLIIHSLAVQFKQIEMRYSNTSVSNDNLCYFRIWMICFLIALFPLWILY